MNYADGSPGDFSLALGDLSAPTPNTHSGDDNDIVLESFFYGLTGHIDNFLNLTNYNLQVFIVIGQPITSLDGIDQLKSLKELWVCECYLQDASPVNRCTQLRKLHLYSNRLKSAPSISGLSKLSTLSLASNKITSLTSRFPQSLREINVADNGISDISELIECMHLEILNLAGTNIKDFHALRPLKKLPKLRHLYTIDPAYALAPISSLVNYRSCTIRNLEQLKYLDGVYIEPEERENVRTFYDKKCRHYRNIYNNYTNVFFYEHRKLITHSYNELTKLKNATMITTMILNKSSDTSSIRKECRRKQEKYEVSQFQWERKHQSWYHRLEIELIIKYTLLEMELAQYGNLNFVYYTKESSNNVLSYVSGIMQGFICPYTKRNIKLSSVEVDRVIQIITSHHHAFDTFKGVQEIMGIGIMENEFFIICQPINVANTSDWPFSFINDYIMVREPNRISCKVTNSVAIADEEWLRTNEGEKYSVADEKLSETRIGVLGFVISDELMGSFTRIETADLHLKSNDEPPEHCFHCAIYSSVIPENVIPTFIVEYRYIHKGKPSLSFDDDLNIPEGESVILKQTIAASSKINTTAWQNLTSLNISKTSICNFGKLSTFDTIVELDVSYNQISSLQEIARIFPKLVYLDAKYNEIASTNMGKEMKSLKVLNIKHNKLTKYLINLQWLKRYCKSLAKLDIAFNPLIDVHRLSHMKYLIINYFHEFRKLNDEWLDDIRDPKTPYKLSLVDFQSAEISSVILEEIKASSTVQSRGSSCFQYNHLPTSHTSVNDKQELICVFLLNAKRFQQIEIDNGKTTLIWLTIKNNILSSVQILDVCPRVEEVDFSYNLILSTSPFADISLKYLVKLNLMCNYLKDLDGFLKADLPNIKCLNVSYNFIRKLDGIKYLKSLEEVYAAGNEVKKWEHLQFIKDFALLKIIDLSANPIDDSELLRKFLIYYGAHLEYVNGTFVSEEDITDANDTHSGTLNKNYLIKIYKPNQLKMLTELTVKRCGIRKANLRDSDFHNLVTVNLENNSVGALGPFGYLKSLKHLCLSNNKVVSFGEPKKTFEALESLHLNFNEICDLLPLELERFPTLTALFLQDNQLTTIDGIKELRRLQYLVLDRNIISNIKQDNLELDSLKELYVEHNQLKELSFLRNIRNVKKLFLAYNKLQEQPAIENLSIMKKLTELTIIGNPVARFSNHYALIFSLLPKLAIMDGHDVHRQEEN